jgi:hypothetical protein
MALKPVPQIGAKEDPTLAAALVALNETLKETNTHLAYVSDKTGDISDAFAGFQKFGTKWLPWIAAVLGLCYPKLLQFIQSIPLPSQ